MPRGYFIYPTNNFTHHNNVRYYFYKTYVNQCTRLSSFNAHQVEIVNNTNNVLEFVGWTLNSGRVYEDFHTREVKPGLSSVAYVVPSTHGNFRVEGAAVFRVKGGNQYYTVAFSDSFLLSTKTSGVRGHIEEGNDVNRAIALLRDDSPKNQQWGSYEFNSSIGRGRSTFTVGARRA